MISSINIWYLLPFYANKVFDHVFQIVFFFNLQIYQSGLSIQKIFQRQTNSRCKYYNKIFQSRINSNGHISIQHLKIHIFNNFIHIFRLQISIQLSCMRMHFQQPSHSPGLIRNIPVSRRVSSRQDARDNSPAKLTTKWEFILKLRPWPQKRLYENSPRL